MKKITQKIGLIGVGNMGAAILEGVLRQEIQSSENIWIFDKISEKSSQFQKKFQVNVAANSKELVSTCDVILLAIKPQDFSKTADEIKEVLEGKILISILAGMKISRMQEDLSSEAQLVRVMPNLGAQVNASVTAICASHEEAFQVANRIFQGCGKTLKVQEDQFDLVTAVSGSGPAYFFYLIELLTEEAKAGGMSSHDARLLALQTALGSALLAEASQESAEELRKRVTSKGGTTEAALKVMMDEGMDQIVKKAILAAKKRSEELSGS